MSEALGNPRPTATAEECAQAAYAAYGASTGGKTWDGRDMPAWADLGGKIQSAWVAAAKAVVTATFGGVR